MNKLQIYKASAGSGKTFLLTENFLKLALENPVNFHKILAVTFTNKAAEEMKNRIIEDLNEIILYKEKAKHFKSIQRHLNLKTEKDFLDRAHLLRDNILHNYSLFNVGTIDSFVQKVIRAFSFEMNLNSVYDIELDTNKVTDDLTDLLYESISENIQIQNWLIKFAEHKINQGENWDFRSQIKTLSEEIFKEKFQSIYPENSKIEDKKAVMNDFLTVLYSIKNSFEKKMNHLSLQYQTVLNKAGIDSTAYGNNFKFISGHFLKKIPNKEYDDISQTLIKSKDGIENWHAKTAKKELIETLNLVFDDLHTIVLSFFQIMENESEEYYSSEHIIKSFHSFGLLNDIADFLPNYRNDNNLLLISDTTLLLKKIIGDNDAPFIYEKMGNHFNNILIDEFQDTSGFQWENFKPLVINSLSQGFYNLIVGDIKQSIYRWRGGDWKILLNGVKKDIGFRLIEEKTLETNWRSQKNIIEFNNSVFHYLPEIIQNQYNIELESINNKEVYSKLCEEGFKTILTDAYEGNFQKIPESENIKGGKVQIYFQSKTKIEEEKLIDQNKFPELINELLKDQKNKPGDIGILVRSNNQAKNIVDILLDYQYNKPNYIKYQIISADSLYIGNSASVKLIVCALKYLENSENEINLAQLIYEYQNLTKNDSIDFNEIFLSVKNKTYNTYLPEDFIGNNKFFSKKSLFELSEDLIRIFKLNLLKNEFPYLRSFQDFVSDFMKNKNGGLSEFIRRWDEKGKTESVQISDKIDAVKILTIHKSKGLAFNIVLMPFTDWSLDHGTKSPLLWTKPLKAPFNVFPYLPVNYSSGLVNTIFRKEYFDEKLFAYTDALNMLYVAFTRAKRELHIFSKISENSKRDKISDVGTLLYELIQMNSSENTEKNGKYINLNQYYNVSEKVFISDKEHKNSELVINHEQSSEQIQEISELLSYPNNNWQEKVKIKYNSEDFFIDSIEKVEEKVNYGTLMHQIFAEIKTANDVDLSLTKLYSEGYFTKEEQKELSEKIHFIIKKPIVNNWFSDKYEVKNEEALITLKGNIRIPDRVLINENEVIVIDFKFGKQQEKYKEQLSEYKQLIKEVYKLPAKAFIFYVEEDVIDEV